MFVQEILLTGLKKKSQDDGDFRVRHSLPAKNFSSSLFLLVAHFESEDLGFVKITSLFSSLTDSPF